MFGDRQYGVAYHVRHVKVDWGIRINEYLTVE
jgi:hypothetical protein